MTALIKLSNTRQLCEALSQITGHDAVIVTTHFADSGLLVSAFWDDGYLRLRPIAGHGDKLIPFEAITEVDLTGGRA